MKFKNDNQRKAVFANIFGKGENRHTKVQSFGSVTNFEVKRTSKIYKHSFSNKNMNERKSTLSDIKTKDLAEFCNMCKSRNFKLKDGRCKKCIKEVKKFKPEKDKISISPRLIENMEEHMDITEAGLEGDIDVKRESADYVDSMSSDYFEILTRADEMKEKIPRILALAETAKKLLRDRRIKEWLGALDELERYYQEDFWGETIYFKEQADVEHGVADELTELYEKYYKKGCPYWLCG